MIFSFLIINNRGSNFYYNDFIGRLVFTLSSISSNHIFFSMHAQGILGSPRRIPDHPTIYAKFNFMNPIALIGILITPLSSIISLIYQLFIQY